MKRKKLVIYKILISAISSALLLSCASYDPVNIESDFGNSVRHMIEQQVVKPADDQTRNIDAGSNYFDGGSVVNSIDTYRKGQKQAQKKLAADQFKIGN